MYRHISTHTAQYMGSFMIMIKGLGRVIFFLQVSSNGLISFNREVDSHQPVLFPNSSNSRYIVAPFWADQDPRPAGQISYESYYKSDLVSMVSEFLRQRTEIDFEGSWMLVARWDGIPEHQSNVDKVQNYSVTSLHANENFLCTGELLPSDSDH